ncbi:unnamed protein product [Penicillium manginii]
MSTILGCLATAAMLPSALASSSTLAALALQNVLDRASPIFGSYVNRTPDKAEWMKAYPDNTPLVHLNIPGTHDSATWNYDEATQRSLKGITDLNQVTVPVPETFRCQDLPFIEMLDMGIRAFDLRYSFDPTNTTLVFYHGPALLSETATVDDVLFGFYQWLDDHPSETIFLSFQHESSTAKYASNNAELQLNLYNILVSAEARHYFLQKKDQLGNLGEARGKIILLRRFDLDQLDASYTEALPGLHFSPSLWTDNSPDISLVYNSKKNLTAFIEDYYQPLTPTGSSAVENIRWKFNATKRHLLKAATGNEDSLFWSFASGGVNHQLVSFLEQSKGKRLGIVMFDFFEQPSELIDTFLTL